MRVTAIIPAKGTSHRLPGKNMLAFGDSTLLGHKIDQLRQCNRIDEVVVGSDDDAILAFAAARGATPRKRDAYHCDESQCSANEMIRNLAAMVECDVVVWAHCTNPLCTPDLYDAAVDAFLDAGGHDSLCSVTRVQRHCWQGGKPANFNPWGERHPFASELEPSIFQDGAIFIQPHRQMLDNGYFYGKAPRLFEVEQPYGWDIDTARDLCIARHLYAAMRQEAACL